MKIKRSAGILLYKHLEGQLLLLLVHPGRPFWKNKDIGAWSIPQDEFDEDENSLDATIREFTEETGTTLIKYGCLTLRSNKMSNKTTKNSTAIHENNCDDINIRVMTKSCPKGQLGH